jgi:SAM-dependent methyltransferase
MPKIAPFEQYAARYETWFEKNRWVYEAELRAVKALLPTKGQGVEIGVGTGRFAEPLGIKIGIEPSKRMREIAEKRGIHTLEGVAENLPLRDSAFEFVLFVTTVCFLDDIDKAFREAYRVLKKGGWLVAGLVDRESPVGQLYLKHQNENVFYKGATFFSVKDAVEHMRKVGFKNFDYRQTIFKSLAETKEDEPVKPYYGKGSFVVIRGMKVNNWGSGKGRYQRGGMEAPQSNAKQTKKIYMCILWFYSRRQVRGRYLSRLWANLLEMCKVRISYNSCNTTGCLPRMR